MHLQVIGHLYFKLQERVWLYQLGHIELQVTETD